MQVRGVVCGLLILVAQFSILAQQEAFDQTIQPLRTSVRNPEAIAVLIGLKQYNDPQVFPVPYAVNDVNLVKQYLIDTMGFKPENVITLTNEKATAGAIKTALRRQLPGLLVQNRSDVFIYYSGHGGPCLDERPGSREETNGCLLPYDWNPNYTSIENTYPVNDLNSDL